MTSTTVKQDELSASLSTLNPFKTLDELTEREAGHPPDDFAASGITSPDDLRALFAERFYCGCEAGDPATAWAFDPHGKHRLNAMFSSDVGHFDVIDMTEGLEGAYELVDDGMMTADNFRHFVFTHAARLHTALNPEFSKGSMVEDTVATQVLQTEPTNQSVEIASD